MNLVGRLFLSVVVAASAILALACPDRTRIGEIEANPSRYQNKEVVIAGTVKDSYGINIPGTQMRGGAYKIDDGSGAIWIFTEEGVPTKGAQVGVKGIIGSGVNWHGKNYGLGLYEKDRRFQKR